MKIGLKSCLLYHKCITCFYIGFSFFSFSFPFLFRNLFLLCYFYLFIPTLFFSVFYILPLSQNFLHIVSQFLFLLSHSSSIYRYSHWVVVYSLSTEKIDSMLGKRLSILTKHAFIIYFLFFIVVIGHLGKPIITVPFILHFYLTFSLNCFLL